MITRVNRTEEILGRLEKIPIEWTQEQMEKWNEQMEELHRDYLNKSAGSIISARDCWVW
jgi:hypothetical protein